MTIGMGIAMHCLLGFAAVEASASAAAAAVVAIAAVLWPHASCCMLAADLS